jgi:hypothetical protein
MDNSHISYFSQTLEKHSITLLFFPFIYYLIIVFDILEYKNNINLNS